MSLTLYHNRLYNKEALLMGLLDRANLPENASHIRSLKVIETTVLYDLSLSLFPTGYLRAQPNT